jgi:hypothetical protein
VGGGGGAVSKDQGCKKSGNRFSQEASRLALQKNRRSKSIRGQRTKMFSESEDQHVQGAEDHDVQGTDESVWERP